jgi:hypothetical protein
MRAECRLIAVTILTSLSDDDIWAAGFETAKDTQSHARAVTRPRRRRRRARAEKGVRGSVQKKNNYF